MKAKLYKTEKENYVLVDPTKGTYDNGYMLGTSRESQYNKLSMKNCQAIERGYDLDELASIFISSGKTIGGGDSGWIKSAFKEGFQKCLELMGDKKFSEEDVRCSWEYGNSLGITGGARPSDLENYLHREYLQYYEWDVEIEETLIQSSIDGEAIWKPALDKDGCLILKRI